MMKPVSGFFWAVTGAAVVLAFLIVVLSGPVFLAISNYLQIITALAGAVILMYLWHISGRQQYLLWTGAGFWLWGVSNIAWYVNALMGFRDQVFPSRIDVGMIVAIILMAVGLWKGLPGKKAAPVIIGVILVISLVIPAWILITSGFSLAVLIALFYYAACGLLVASGLDFSLRERPLPMLGTVLFALAFMIYPLREMFLVTNPILPVIGTFVCAGLSLITLGLIPGSGTGKTA